MTLHYLDLPLELLARLKDSWLATFKAYEQNFLANNDVNCRDVAAEASQSETLKKGADTAKDVEPEAKRALDETAEAATKRTHNDDCGEDVERPPKTRRVIFELAYDGVSNPVEYYAEHIHTVLKTAVPAADNQFYLDLVEYVHELAKIHKYQTSLEELLDIDYSNEPSRKVLSNLLATFRSFFRLSAETFVRYNPFVGSICETAIQQTDCSHIYNELDSQIRRSIMGCAISYLVKSSENCRPEKTDRQEYHNHITTTSNKASTIMNFLSSMELFFAGGMFTPSILRTNNNENTWKASQIIESTQAWGGNSCCDMYACAPISVQMFLEVVEILQAEMMCISNEEPVVWHKQDYLIGFFKFKGKHIRLIFVNRTPYSVASNLELNACKIIFHRQDMYIHTSFFSSTGL